MAMPVVRHESSLRSTLLARLGIPCSTNSGLSFGTEQGQQSQQMRVGARVQGLNKSTYCFCLI